MKRIIEKHYVRLLMLILMVASFVLTMPPSVRCNEVSINVLTINLLFSEIKDRDSRLDIIADYVGNSPEPIDVILLQEVVGGPLSRTFNSALDLKNKLAKLDKNYNLRYRLANGLPGILTVGNAILSLHDILFTLSKTLPFESEEIFEGIEIPLKRKAMMSRIKVPGFGNINVYNTHLCAYCTYEERLEQVEVLLDFVDTVEWLIPGRNPVILGGDFNVPDALISTGLAPEYNLIIGEGFVDSYAYVNNCIRCCSESNQGCTYGVDDNPYAFNPFTGEREETVRIDYIFTKDVNQIISSEVIFNEYPNWVSDHSAVFTKLRLK